VFFAGVVRIQLAYDLDRHRLQHQNSDLWEIDRRSDDLVERASDPPVREAAAETRPLDYFDPIPSVAIRFDPIPDVEDSVRFVQKRDRRVNRQRLDRYASRRRDKDRLPILRDAQTR